MVDFFLGAILLMNLLWLGITMNREAVPSQNLLVLMAVTIWQGVSGNGLQIGISHIRAIANL
jgi:hypothetical protein